MHRHRFFAVAAGLVLLAGSAAVDDAANAEQHRQLIPSRHGAESTPSPPPVGRGDACYSQLDGQDLRSVTSQNFEKPKDTLDALGADDFTLRGECRVSKVSIEGSYLNFAQAPSSMHVTFYRSDAGHVGEVLSSQDKLRYTKLSDQADFVVDLARPLSLSSGRYWVSVQANMNSTTQGLWYWSTNAVLRGNPAKWENPKGGWGTFCTTWKDLVQCLGPDLDPDFTFALLK